MANIAFRAEEVPSPKTGGVLPLADDILRGADRIAEFIFGNPSERRKIYHLAEKSRLPVFRLGSVLCARKSTILDWVAEQEARATGASR